MYVYQSLIVKTLRYLRLLLIHIIMTCICSNMFSDDLEGSNDHVMAMLKDDNHHFHDTFNQCSVKAFGPASKSMDQY